jgi:hypothetical protein
MHPVKAQQLVEGGSPNLIIQHDPQWNKKTSKILPKRLFTKTLSRSTRQSRMEHVLLRVDPMRG